MPIQMWLNLSWLTAAQYLTGARRGMLNAKVHLKLLLVLRSSSVILTRISSFRKLIVSGNQGALSFSFDFAQAPFPNPV